MSKPGRDRDPQGTLSTEPIAPGSPPGSVRLGAIGVPPEFESRFQSLSELARGGQGRVLSARDSVLDREVALKELLRAGTEGAIRRFEREARLTARLQHPAIVSIYELTRRSSGEPVLVMRRVRGKPFDRAIADASSYEQRLVLLAQFTAACDAIAYAHQQGVIHRDIKPSNVLLGDFGDTVVIDWGIAKEVGTPASEEAEGERPAAGEGLTAAGQLLGTPAFMSPEQARGEAADARSDVYSLGAMLYQLVAGQQAYQAKTAEDVLAAVRAGPPAPIASLVPGVAPELATMVGRAMARDKQDRYANAGELSEELKRFQTGRLVRSHSYSTWQLLRRWARRHAALLAVIGISLLLIAAGAIFSVRRVLAEKERASREAATARRALDFMSGMFKLSDPSEARGNSVTAREILDKAAEQIGSGLAQDPEVQARLLKTMGEVYANLGLYPQALRSLESASKILAERLGPDHPESLSASLDLAKALRLQRKLADAEKLALDVSSRAQRALGASHPVTLQAQNQLGVIYRRQKRLPEAEKALSAALQTARRALGPSDPVTLALTDNLANTINNQGRGEEAAQLLRELLEVLRRVYGPDHPDTIGAMNNLGSAYYTQHRADEALAMFREVAAADRRVLGPDHPETVAALGNVATVLYEQRRYQEAEPLAREVLEGRKRRLGPDNPDTLDSMNDLAGVLLHLGRLDEAEKMLPETLAGMRKAHGPSHADVATTLTLLSWLAVQRGDKDRALSFLREALDHGLAGGEAIKAVEDPLFQPLSGDPRFQAMAAEARSKKPM